MSRRVAFAFIALLALAMFARPLFRGEVLTFRDNFDYFQPLRYFTAVELRFFHLPLWNPYNASGEPWLANPQTAVFYPPFWIFLVVPFAQAYVLFVLLHFILLGCGAFLLFSRFASSRAAFVGAVILMLCGPTLSMLDIQNNLTTFAWLPLVLWCALAGASSALSGSVIAMSLLAGEPFFAATGALMFAIVRIVSGKRKPAGTLASILDTAITAFCLAGVTLVPFLSMIAGSDRAGAVPANEVLRDSMPPLDWLRMVLPGALTHQQFIPIVYIGIVPALLALVGMAMSVRVRAARPWLVLLAASILFAAGSYFPLVGTLLVKLPLTILRYPARVIPLGALALVALAAIGFDAAARVVRFGALPLAVVLIIADLVPHVAPMLHSAPFDVHTVPYSLNVGRGGKIARFMAPEGRLDRRVWISGYLNLLERRFDAWTAAPVISQAYMKLYAEAVARREVLNAMSIEYIVTQTRRGIVAERNAAALPLAYVRDVAGRLIAPSSLAFTTRAVFATFDLPAGGIAVVTQQEAAGWDVEVDGVRAVAQREGLFRAVRIASGHHVVVWLYHPRAFLIGSALSILAIARLLLSKIFVKRKWHEKNLERDPEFS